MEEYFYIEILIEDASGGILVKHIMDKYAAGRENIEYKLHSFKGIGKIPTKVNKLSQVKSGKLLTDLPQYLRGISAAIKNVSGKKAIFVILDSDDEDCAELKDELIQMYQTLDLPVQAFFCIAIEEMEAWLLGDEEALTQAYPSAKRSVLQHYVQDSAVGTWEVLADAICPGGAKRLKKTAAWYEIGKLKSEWADKIGERLDIRNNASQSFRYFIGKLDSFCDGDSGRT